MENYATLQSVPPQQKTKTSFCSVHRNLTVRVGRSEPLLVFCTSWVQWLVLVGLTESFTILDFEKPADVRYSEERGAFSIMSLGLGSYPVRPVSRLSARYVRVKVPGPTGINWRETTLLRDPDLCTCGRRG